MNTYLLSGIIIFLGIAISYKWNQKQPSGKAPITANLTSSLTNERLQDKRHLTLIVAYDYGEKLDTISKNVTPEIVRSTMHSINWNEFHIVQLEYKNGNALHVSGSLAEDGLASGFVSEEDHLLKVKSPESVEEMTQILLDFLKGEEIWRSKYKYQ